MESCQSDDDEILMTETSDSRARTRSAGAEASDKSNGHRNSIKGRQKRNKTKPKTRLTTTTVNLTRRNVKRKKNFNIHDPIYKLPFNYGWLRELVYRNDKSSKNADVYYYSPNRKKLRSTREIQDQLNLSLFNKTLTVDNFTFFKQPIGMDDKAKEIIRDAIVIGSKASSKIFKVEDLFIGFEKNDIVLDDIEKKKKKLHSFIKEKGKLIQDPSIFDNSHVNKKSPKSKSLSSLETNSKNNQNVQSDLNCQPSLGNNEPEILPTGQCLRPLKSRHLSNTQKHKDVLTSLAFMKQDKKYKNILHDVGIYPFFVHYNSAEQIDMYRSYCSSTENPKLVIGVTGSIVKKFLKFELDKTNNIFLYEAFVYDSHKKQNFTVTNMISESHSNVAISNWLLKWINTDVKKPKETVSDNSLALLSAIVQNFTQYSSVQDYVRVCADILFEKISPHSHWLPQCFVRVDVAHFIKICCHCFPLKDVPQRVREIVLRSMGLLIISQYMTEIYSILLSMFVVFTNETEGINIETGEETPCEIHKKKIIEATSSGRKSEFQQYFDDTMTIAEYEDEKRILLEDIYNTQNEGLYDFENPFQSWANGIYEKSKNFIKNGPNKNDLYVPSMVQFLIKITKLLPLWSGVMVPKFGYGDDVSSSSAVEPSFRKFETDTFRQLSLPTELESFLKNHIKSLEEAALLISASNNDALSSSFSVDFNEVYMNIDNVKSAFSFIEENEGNLNVSLNRNDKTNRDLVNYPKENINQSKEEEYLIPTISHLNDENKDRKSWIKRNNTQKKSQYQNETSLPLLKNGSPHQLRNTIRKNDGIILKNTCAFDALTSLIMVAHCDSEKFNAKQFGTSKYLEFVTDIVEKGISPETYERRTKLIVNYFNPTMNQLARGGSIAVCDATMSKVLKTLISDIPSAVEIIECSLNTCKTHINRNVKMYFTFQVSNKDDISKLKTYFNTKSSPEQFSCSQNCNGKKTVSTNISKTHLFFDVFFWEGENSQKRCEAGTHIRIRLCDIPCVIEHNTIKYELRGIISFFKGKSNNRISVGHYKAYTRRTSGNWVLFDDLKEEPEPVNETLMVPCEFLLYSV